MQANVANFAAIDSLPSFRLFTWFFVVPGVLLVLLGLVALLRPGRRQERRPADAL